MLKILGSVVLVAVMVTYLRGWRHLAALGHQPPRWRLACYGAGLATVGAALITLDEMADTSFSMHMVQHLLLVMVGAPLVALGNPLPCLLWGLPRRARATLAATLRPRGWSRRALSALTFIPIAGGVYTVTLWIWHVPILYDAAVEHEALHALEHAMFFLAAMLFWWPIVQPAPRLHARLHSGFKILYLVVATALNTALGMALAMPERSLYPHYARLAPAIGVNAVDDQAFGGGLMWMMGHMYLLPILLILYEIARDSERSGEDTPGA